MVFCSRTVSEAEAISLTTTILLIPQAVVEAQEGKIGALRRRLEERLDFRRAQRPVVELHLIHVAGGCKIAPSPIGANVEVRTVRQRIIDRDAGGRSRGQQRRKEKREFTQHKG